MTAARRSAGRPPRRRRARPTPGLAAALLLTLASAGLTILAHPPTGAWPLAFVMLAPLVMALEGASFRRAFGLGLLYLGVAGTGVVRWLVHALAAEYHVPMALSWAITFGIVGAMALMPALGAALYVLVRRQTPDGWAPLSFAGCWVLQEWVRAVPLAVPWLLLGLATPRFPLALQTADLGGIWAVGLVIGTANAALGLAAARRRWAPLWTGAAVVAAALAYGAFRLTAADALGPPGAPAARVGIVQAALPPSERFRPGSAERNLALHARLTRELVRRTPVDLVVWAETAIDGDLEASPGLRRAVEALTDEIGAPLLTGAARAGAGPPRNSVVLFAPGEGLVEAYDKQRLVPLAESDPPFADALRPLLGELLQGRPYLPGQEPTVFRRTPIPLSAPICFEVTYPDLVSRFRRSGARLLANLSNDAWFGRTGYPEMHLGHAVLRAVEGRTWVVRAANTGISAVIAPTGRVVDELPIYEVGSLSHTVRAAGPPTPYVRWGDGPALAAVALLLALGAVVPRFRA